MQNGAEVGALAFDHILLVLTALAAALLVAAPIGVAAARKRYAAPLITLLGALYTIPSLALLAFLVPYTGLGFWTAVIVLAAYAQFILVRNIAAGFAGVPTAQIETARALGMNARQCFLQIELPFALPVAIGGIRIATVSMIAIATVAAYIGAQDLGTLIFNGLNEHYTQEILAGSIPAALLAILADGLLRTVERRAQRRIA